jgi:phosphopantothenate synthetase
MENKNSDIEIIKNIVKSTPNDSELGQKMRKFFREEKKDINKKRKDD